MEDDVLPPEGRRKERFVSKIAKGRCFLAIEADRSIPIVRSAVLERNGTPPPACIIPNPKKHHKPD